MASESAWALTVASSCSSEATRACMSTAAMTEDSGLASPVEALLT